MFFISLLVDHVQSSRYDFCFYLNKSHCSNESIGIPISDLDQFYNFSLTNVTDVYMDIADSFFNSTTKVEIPLNLSILQKLNLQKLFISGHNHEKFSMVISQSFNESFSSIYFQDLFINFSLLSSFFFFDEVSFSYCELSLPFDVSRLIANSAIIDCYSILNFVTIQAQNIFFDSNTISNNPSTIQLIGKNLQIQNLSLFTLFSIAGSNLVISQDSMNRSVSFGFNDWDLLSPITISASPASVIVCSCLYYSDSLPKINFNFALATCALFEASSWPSFSDIESPLGSIQLNTFNQLIICDQIPFHFDASHALTSPNFVLTNSHVSIYSLLSGLVNINISYLDIDTSIFTLKRFETSGFGPISIFNDNPSLVFHPTQYYGDFILHGESTLKTGTSISGIFSISCKNFEFDQDIIYEPFDLDHSSSISSSAYFNKNRENTFTIVPVFFGNEQPSSTDIIQHFGNITSFFCSPTLDCNTFDYQFPETGFNGFTDSSSLFDPICFKQGNSTCSGIKLMYTFDDFSDRFCSYNNSSSCPVGTTPLTENWYNKFRINSHSIPNIYIYVDHDITISNPNTEINLTIINPNQNTISVFLNGKFKHITITNVSILMNKEECPSDLTIIENGKINCTRFNTFEADLNSFLLTNFTSITNLILSNCHSSNIIISLSFLSFDDKLIMVSSLEKLSLLSIQSTTTDISNITINSSVSIAIINNGVNLNLDVSESIQKGSIILENVSQIIEMNSANLFCSVFLKDNSSLTLVNKGIISIDTLRPQKSSSITIIGKSTIETMYLESNFSFLGNESSINYINENSVQFQYGDITITALSLPNPLQLSCSFSYILSYYAVKDIDIIFNYDMNHIPHVIFEKGKIGSFVMHHTDLDDSKKTNISSTYLTNYGIELLSCAKDSIAFTSVPFSSSILLFDGEYSILTTTITEKNNNKFVILTYNQSPEPIPTSISITTSGKAVMPVKYIFAIIFSIIAFGAILLIIIHSYIHKWQWRSRIPNASTPSQMDSLISNDFQDRNLHQSLIGV